MGALAGERGRSGLLSASGMGARRPNLAPEPPGAGFSGKQGGLGWPGCLLCYRRDAGPLAADRWARYPKGVLHARVGLVLPGRRPAPSPAVLCPGLRLLGDLPERAREPRLEARGQRQNVARLRRLAGAAVGHRGLERHLAGIQSIAATRAGGAAPAAGGLATRLAQPPGGGSSRYPTPRSVRRRHGEPAAWRCRRKRLI
jgi:hypothetical protein